jgi:catechol 2,3-dioxygenase-like lactoylglutathione lyase family enzyme
MIQRFDHIEFNVNDVEKAKKFFVEKLGFRLHSVIRGQGVFVKSGDAIVGLFKGKPLGLVHIAMTVDDVENSVIDLGAKGVVFRTRPHANNDTGRMVCDLRIRTAILGSLPNK